MSQHFWALRRTQYEQMCDLISAVDKKISHLIFFSYSANLFFICKQLFESLRWFYCQYKMKIFLYIDLWFQTNISNALSHDLFLVLTHFSVSTFNSFRSFCYFDIYQYFVCSTLCIISDANKNFANIGCIASGCSC